VARAQFQLDIFYMFLSLCAINREHTKRDPVRVSPVLVLCGSECSL
jgi:hypothetical protein